MSGSAACLSCPVCSNKEAFESSQSLKERLEVILDDKIMCPVCQDVFLGLKELISHLVIHDKIIKNTKIQNGNIDKIMDAAETKVKQNNTVYSSNKVPLKYVKIFPKLPIVTPNPFEKGNDNKIETEPDRNKNAPNNADTTCKLCGLQFVDTHVLKMHMCLIHNIEEVQSQNVTKYNCHLCPKHFKMRGSLMVHLRVAHFGFNHKDRPQQNVNELEEKSDEKQLSSSKIDNKQWQCEVCCKFFTTKYFLKKHKRLHTGETPYACTLCNKTFTFQQSYHKHLLYHNDEKPHSCNVCGRAFKELSTLHNHQRIHTGEKPFSCETCGKCFRQRVSYLVHRRIHTGAMPYKCTACNKSFRYKVSQRTHKCPAQPPGIVVRQSGDLVEKLKRKQISRFPNALEKSVIEVSAENAELVRNGAMLSLEDTENENFNIIAAVLTEKTLQNNIDIIECNHEAQQEVFESHFDDIINFIPVETGNTPSPSDILKNLCLSQDDLDDSMNLML